MKKILMFVLCAALCLTTLFTLFASAATTPELWLSDFKSSLSNDFLNINWKANEGQPGNADITIDKSVTYATDATLKWAWNLGLQGWSQLNYVPDNDGYIYTGVQFWAKSDTPVQVEVTLVVDWVTNLKCKIDVDTTGKVYTINWRDSQKSKPAEPDVDFAKKHTWYMIMGCDLNSFYDNDPAVTGTMWVDQVRLFSGSEPTNLKGTVMNPIEQAKPVVSTTPSKPADSSTPAQGNQGTQSTPDTTQNESTGQEQSSPNESGNESDVSTASTATPAAPGNSNQPVIILLIVFIVVVIVAAGAVIFLLLKKGTKSPAAMPDEIDTQDENEDSNQ